MKFFQAAIALFAAIATFGANAAVPNSKRNLKKLLDHRMKNGLYDKRTLVKGAQPYSDAAKDHEARRKLDYDITGAFSIQFQSCFSLTTSYEDIFDDNDQGGGLKMGMFQNGELIALKSYAIFRLCYNGQCGSNGNNGMLDYVVDLDTYVQALVNYLPDQMEGFCEGCMENQESCLMVLYGGYAGAYQNGNQYAYRQNYNANDNNYNGANVNNVNYNYGGNYGGNQANNAYQGGYNGDYDNGNDDNGNGYQGGYYNNNGGQQQQGQAYQNGYDNGGNRKLIELHEFEKRVLQNGQVVKQLDCNLCQQYGCLNDDDSDNDVYGFEAASEWLQETAECRETGVQYSGYSSNNNNGYYQQGGGDENEIFAGFICNSDGSGVELGLFLDEECVLYMTNEPYSNYMSYFDQTYVQMTKEIIEFTFSNAVLSCKEEEITYTTQQVSQYGMYNYQDWNGQDDDNLAEFCDELISGDYEPVDISSCGALNGNYYQQQYNQNYQENYYQQYQQEDENMQYQYQYSWYRYEITLENSYDMYSVCQYMKKNEDGLHTFYNSNNGNMYDYASTAYTASDTISEFMEGSDNEVEYVESSALSFYNRAQNLNAAQKFGIVAGTGIIVGAAIALFLRFRTSSADSKEEALIDDDDAVEQSRKGEVA